MITLTLGALLLVLLSVTAGSDGLRPPIPSPYWEAAIVAAALYRTVRGSAVERRFSILFLGLLIVSPMLFSVLPRVVVRPALWTLAAFAAYSAWRLRQVPERHNARGFVIAAILIVALTAAAYFLPPYFLG